MVWWLLLATVNVQAAPERDESKPLLVASIRPLALIARDLAGEWLTVETLLAANQEPHQVSLTIDQRQKLARAHLVIWVSPRLETYLVRTLEPLDSQRRLSFESVLTPGAGGSAAADYHYWLHPGLAADFYRALAVRLAEIFPDKASAIDRALQQRLGSLADLTDELAEDLRHHADAPLLVDHHAYGHFARAFPVKIVGALVDESGVAAGPRTLAALARQRDIRCIAVESLPPSRRAAKMARTLDVEVVAIDPLGNDVSAEEGYAGLLRSVAAGFRRCLGDVDGISSSAATR